MSLTRDRAELTAILTQALEPLGLKIYGYAPTTVVGNLAWLVPTSIVPDTTFGSLRINWQLTLTASAKASIPEQQRALDSYADAAVQALIEKDAADLESIGEYFAIAESSNGAVYPAARLNLISFTTIKE